MAKTKRPLDGADPTELDNVHASRKKRVRYTEEDANLAEIYNNLANEVQSTRIKAAGDLLKRVSNESSDRRGKLQTAEARLIKGLCSSRKAARLGFSVALTELFRLKFDSESKAKAGAFSLSSTVDEISRLTETQGNVSGQEKRDALVGRRFSFQALLQSDVGLQERLPDRQWEYLLKFIFRLASEKSWLRRECGAAVHEYLVSPNASKLSDVRVRMVVDELVDAKLVKTPEGVGIWLSIQKQFPGVKLPKDVWHHRDPLSSKDLPVLTKVLLETSSGDEGSRTNNGARQSTISFAWKVILQQLYEQGDERFSKFWEGAVASTMFSSTVSNERRALGLQILSLAISTAPKGLLQYVIGAPQILTSILQNRSDSSRYLFDATKVPLNQMVIRAKQEPTTAAIFIQCLAINGRPAFDQITKSKIVEDLVAAADSEALRQVVKGISSAIPTCTSTDHARSDNDRRALTDLFLTLLRAHKQPSEVFLQSRKGPKPLELNDWVTMLLTTLVSFAFSRPGMEVRPAMSDQCQVMLRGRLMSCLNLLMNHPIEQAVLAPLLVVDSLPDIMRVQQDLKSDEKAAITTATEIINDIEAQESPNNVALAFQVLFSLSIIQVYNQEPDSGSAVWDLISCYQSLESSEDASIVLIELLLSFISKPSSLFKKLAQQVFPVFAPQLTPDSLQSLTDILSQKETLSGQQALFDQQEADGDDNEVSPLEYDNEIDVEDASDVELINGHSTLDSDAEDDDSSSDASVSAEDGVKAPDEEEDEAAAFDKKLAEALGTNGMDDSDDDGSDMDDEQMMALEPHLATIFKERQKTSNKKNDRKDAKENIVNFKNRVLDLLMLYVKSQYSNVLALDLLLPLATLIRTTTSKPTAEKAFAVLKQYFETSSKKKEVPKPGDHDACFELLTALHAETKLGGSKLHANACSRASLFLCKVLTGLDLAYYERIANMYGNLQAEWYQDSKSKISNSVFTEWVSWSINTRKHV